MALSDECLNRPGTWSYPTQQMAATEIQSLRAEVERLTQQLKRASDEKRLFRDLLQAEADRDTFLDERDEAQAANVKLIGMLKAIDMELTDGEQGPSETICKIAEVMENYLRMPPQPGAPLLARLERLERVIVCGLNFIAILDANRQDIGLANCPRYEAENIFREALAACKEPQP